MERIIKKPEEIKPSLLCFMTELSFQYFGKARQYTTPSQYTNEILYYLNCPSSKLIIAYNPKEPVGFCFHAPSTIEKNLYKEFLEQTKQKMRYDEKSRTVAIIAVLPEHKGEGIGSSLIEKVTEDSKSMGASQIYANCIHGKEGESYKFFSRLGFKEIITLPRVYFDGSSATLVVKEI